VRAVLYNDAVALLARLAGPEQIYPLLEELERLRALSHSYLGMSLTVGIGLPCSGPGELHTSVEGAHSALDYRVLIGGDQVIYIGDLEPVRSARLSFEEEDQRALAAAVKLGSEEQVAQVVRGLIDRVRETKLSLPQCHLFFLEMVTSLIKLARSGGAEVEDVFGPGFTGVVS
ncbi:MAG: DNA-binding response regulator, partial [Lawsonibacter sp.]